MEYTAKNIDIDKFIKGLENDMKYQKQRTDSEILRLKSYQAGYQEAIENIIQMFHCSNYEKKENT